MSSGKDEKNRNDYSQVFLEECKYNENEKRWLDVLLMTYKFLLMILIKKVLV